MNIFQTNFSISRKQYKNKRTYIFNKQKYKIISYEKNNKKSA